MFSSLRRTFASEQGLDRRQAIRHGYGLYRPQCTLSVAHLPYPPLLVFDVCSYRGEHVQVRYVVSASLDIRTFLLSSKLTADTEALWIFFPQGQWSQKNGDAPAILRKYVVMHEESAALMEGFAGADLDKQTAGVVKVSANRDDLTASTSTQSAVRRVASGKKSTGMRRVASGKSKGTAKKLLLGDDSDDSDDDIIVKKKSAPKKRDSLSGSNATLPRSAPSTSTLRGDPAKLVEAHPIVREFGPPCAVKISDVLVVECLAHAENTRLGAEALARRGVEGTTASKPTEQDLLAVHLPSSTPITKSVEAKKVLPSFSVSGVLASRLLEIDEPIRMVLTVDSMHADANNIVVGIDISLIREEEVKVGGNAGEYGESFKSVAFCAEVAVCPRIGATIPISLVLPRVSVCPDINSTYFAVRHELLLDVRFSTGHAARAVFPVIVYRK